MTGELPQPSTSKRRLLWFLAVVAVLVLGSTAGYQVLLAQLNQPYFKQTLNSYLSLPNGIAIDYRRLDLAPLSGHLQIEGLRISSPDIYRRHVPLLFEMDRLSVRWSTRALLRKEIAVEQIDAGHLRLHDVVQESGPSTWDLFGDQDQPKPESHEPLSKVARFEWLPLPISIRRCSIAGLDWTRTELDAKGDRVRRLELDGLRLMAEGRLIPGDAAAKVTLLSTAEETPTRLTIHDSRHHNSSAAELQTVVTFNLSASRSAEFSAVADLLTQTIDPSLGLHGRIVDIQGTAEFVPESAMTKLAVTRLDLLQETLSAEFTAELADHSAIPKLLGSGHARLDPLLKLKTGFLPGLDGKDLEVNGRFTMDPDHERAIRVEVAGRADEVRWQQPDGLSLAVEQISLDLRGSIDPDNGADFLLGAPAKHVTYRNRDGQIVSIAHPTVSFESHEWSLDGHTPSSASGTIRSAAIHIGEPRGPLQRAAKQTRFRWELTDFEQHDSPVPVSGRLTLTGLVDELDIAATAWAKDDDAGTDLTVKIGKLGALAQWLPDMESHGIRLERTGMEASVSGRYRNLGRTGKLELVHTVAATLSRFRMQRPGLALESPLIELRAEHNGLDTSHKLAVELDLGRARLNGRPVDINPRLTAGAAYTEAAMHAHADFGMGPAVALSIQATFDPSSGWLTHRSRIAIDRATVLNAWIPKQIREQYPIDWARFTGSLEQEGRVHGLFVMRDSRKAPALTDGPLNSLAAEQTITLEAHGVAVYDGTMAMDLPQCSLRMSGSQRAGRLTGSADLKAPRLKIIHHGGDVHVAAVTQHVDFSADSNPVDGDVELRMTLALQHVRQNYLPFYPISDVTISGRAHLSRLETFVLDDFTLHNKGGGTHITLSKSVNRAGLSPSSGTSRQSLRELTLTGRLTQSLQEWSQPSGAFQGRGLVTAPLTVYSSDGTLFNIAAAVEMDDVSVNVPQSGLSIEAMSGRIQLDETVEWDADDGLSVIHDSERNHFSTSRYQDTQPFLANQSLFKIDRLRWQERTMGPIIGSMHVKNNVFALNKLRIQTDEGTISGQVIFDYAPGAEQIKFRGNVTGVRIGTSRQRLDGNLAFTFVPASLELDGRIQILRLTRQHLEDMLDLLDPFREDAGLNRLRFALAFGYPKFARMEMSQGLAALKVDLGGIGELLTIDEIRGIALGPFMTRHIEPLLNSLWIVSRNRKAS
jgi:translocation and assembly module TamB